MTAKWNKLPVPQEKVPPLLFQYTWTRQGYDLYVTDLTFIWSERLSREEILDRGDERATTIDPSEDPSQLELLLQKVGEALRGEQGTAVTIGSSASPDALELNTTTKLPAPLNSLRWHMQLKRESASAVTRHLVVPLLRGEASWESRRQNLLEQLRQKDWILGKLFNRFEALGADLTAVFPGVAGLRTSRKVHSRSEAAKFIKGVAPFDEKHWVADVESSPNINMVTHLIRELAGSGNDPTLENLRVPQEKWWCLLSQPAKDTSFSLQKAQNEQFQADVDLDGDTASNSEADEFEVCHSIRFLLDTCSHCTSSNKRWFHDTRQQQRRETSDLRLKPQRELLEVSQRLSQKVNKTSPRQMSPSLNMSLAFHLHLEEEEGHRKLRLKFRPQKSPRIHMHGNLKRKSKGVLASSEARRRHPSLSPSPSPSLSMRGPHSPNPRQSLSLNISKPTMISPHSLSKSPHD